jgi:hypothetical protein
MADTRRRPLRGQGVRMKTPNIPVIGVTNGKACGRIVPQVPIRPPEPAIDRFEAELLSIQQIEASDGSALGSAFK